MALVLLGTISANLVEPSYKANLVKACQGKASATECLMVTAAFLTVMSEPVALN